MSILIKGMKMPNACCDCDLLPEEINWDEQWECPITEKIVHKYVEERKGKLQDCPLVEVPEPHGRLVDADFMKELGAKCIAKRCDDGVLLALGRIDDLPTVIEAEEQEQ